jgi:hypothetical protein
MGTAVSSPNPRQTETRPVARCRQRIINAISGSEPDLLEVENGGDAVIVPLYAPDIYAVMSWAPEQPSVAPRRTEIGSHHCRADC